MAKKKAGCANMALGCLVFIVIGAMFSFMAIDSTVKSVGNYQAEQKAAAEKLDIEKPRGTLERLQHDLASEGELTQTGDVLQFTFESSELMRAAGINHKITNSLRKIRESGYDYVGVKFSALAPFVDEFGNEYTAEVVGASYAKETVDKINFKNFIAANILDIADNKRIHPALNK